MRKTISFLIFVFIMLWHAVVSQNAVESAQNLMRLRSHPEKTDSLFLELANFVDPKILNNGLDFANPFNYKSEYLKKYINGVLTATTSGSLPIYKAFNTQIIQPKTKLGKEKMDLLDKYGINLSGKFEDIKNQLVNIVKDSIDLKTVKVIIDSLGTLAMKSFTTALKTEGERKSVVDAFFKVIVAEGKANLHTNTALEVQNIYTLKESFKMPSESDIIDGMAIFLVKRVKEESVMAFVDGINKNLDKLQPLPCLFENTVKELAGYSPGEATNFGSVTQKAIAQDISQMPDKIIDCSFCGKTNDVKKHADFTKFLDDISEGVDLITNVSFFAEKKDPSDKNFNYTLKLLDFVNKYYSNISLYGADKKNYPISTWLGPDFIRDQNDTLLKLSLAIVYEKEKPLFDEFLKTRFGCINLDDFFSSKITFENFKENFKKLFYSLHRLDSYWQTNRTDGKAILDMTVYKNKITEVLKDVYCMMNYPDSSFALNSTLYKTYLKAKTSVANLDIQNVIYHSQQLLDILSCYEMKLPGFKLPKFEGELKFCSDDTLKSFMSMYLFSQLQGKTSTKMDSIDKIKNFIRNDTLMAKLTNLLFCNSPEVKCKLFNGRFTKYKNKVTDRVKENKFELALDWKFRPWLHPFMWVFHHENWKFAFKLNEIRKTHRRQKKLEKDSPKYMCYLEIEKKLENKNSFCSSRREVSQVLNFFTDLNKAKDSKQLSTVIEKYAEPPQSYKIKRFSNFSFDINAYPGVYGGIETPSGYDIYSKDSITVPVAGITAPIGFSLSWAGRLKFKCENKEKFPVHLNKKGKIKSFRGDCFTTSIMIFDIGAVVSYRFSHDASQALPQEANFSQVLAPGIYVGYGIPGLPLTFNGGIQYTPQLRKFGGQNGKFMDTYRIGLTLCYDIPILNITNTNRKAKRLNK